MAKKSPMARLGKKNGRWKGGTSKSYYRKKAGAKTGDGKVVHHKTYKKKNLTKKSNYKLVTRGDHNKIHPGRSKSDSKIDKSAERKLGKSKSCLINKDPIIIEIIEGKKCN